MENRPGFSYTELRNMAIYKRKLIMYKIIDKIQRANEKQDPSKRDESHKLFKQKIQNMQQG